MTAGFRLKDEIAARQQRDHRVLAYVLLVDHGEYFAGYRDRRLQTTPVLAEAKLFAPNELITRLPQVVDRLARKSRPAALLRVLLHLPTPATEAADV